MVERDEALRMPRGQEDPGHVLDVHGPVVRAVQEQQRAVQRGDARALVMNGFVSTFGLAGSTPFPE